MADDAPDASPRTDPVNIETKEDAETRAARRELKQSSISDDPNPTGDSATPTAAAAGGSDTPSAVNSAARPGSPADVSDTDLKDQIASPKKKRAHDQLDGDKATDDNDATSVASTDSGKDRASRLEPEKKRHRDEESNDTDLTSKATEDSSKAAAVAGKSPVKKDVPQTSASAFAASSFGKLSSGTSPFATLGANKGSVFASAGPPSLSSFASPPTAGSSPAPPAAAPKLTFGSIPSSTNGFGGGSPFSSTLGVRPLGSFAAPGGSVLKADKPAKPFGAPDSDAEDDDDEKSGDEETKQDEIERSQSPEKESEEKKRLKLQKVEVNDGETGETTILSVRSKIYYLDKEAGWKERGAGMLKINVPTACVDFDETGAVIPGSFDASSLETDNENSENSKVVRLIMRQDQTHRVILNTAILPAMNFDQKATLKSVGIVFTAFEGSPARPVSITMRMSSANAKSFTNEIAIIQKELQSSS